MLFRRRGRGTRVLDEQPVPERLAGSRLPRRRSGAAAVLPPGVEPMMVGSSSPAAQMLVLEGMTHLLTFGDMRAFLKFDAALRLDPDCLMAHWGRCMSLMGAGPAFQDQRVHSHEAA